MIKQFLCFAGVGAVGTSAHYLVLVFSVEMLSIDPVLGSILGFLVGAVVNYILNYHITFKSNRSHYEAGPKFLLTAIVGGLVNFLIMTLLIKKHSLNYLMSQLIATAVVLFWNFIVAKIWVFNEHKLKKIYKRP